MKIFRLLTIAVLIAALPFQARSQEYIAEMIEIPDDISDMVKSQMPELAVLSNPDNQQRYDLFAGTQPNLSRTEKRSFDSASKVNIDQNRGNVTIQEANGRKIDVTVQYFDTETRKAECRISTQNGELNIETLEPAGKTGCYINYIISLPKGIAVDAKINYGNISIDKVQAPCRLNLSYSNAAITSSDKDAPEITVKYGSIVMDNAKDISIDAKYSSIKIKSLNTLDLSGSYNSLVLGEIKNTMRFNQQSKYNKYRIESIGNLTADIKYDTFDLGKLDGNIDLKAGYSKIKIGAVSPESRSIKINGAYSVINLSLNRSVSASVEANIKYGDLIVAKEYNAKTVSDNSDSFNVSKKVRIGNATPSLSVIVSNSYSNINIK